MDFKKESSITPDINNEHKKDIIADKDELPKLIQLVNANDVSGAEQLLAVGAASVHDTDSSGMTALMHAAYKGYTDMCKMLLKQGSDVNADSHTHSYSALHFAALSSGLETTQLLLDHGAKTYKTNSLGRTAAQMAGFVGHTQCVAIINNHVNRNELHRFTRPTAQHQTTTLCMEAEEPLYHLIMQVNLHPVHLTLVAGRSSVLLRHLRPASTVLQHMSVDETKRPSNVNEVLSLKFHYLSCLLKAMADEHEKHLKEKEGLEESSETTAGKEGEECSPSLEGFLKHLSKCRSSDDTAVWRERFLRDIIRRFHCIEMPLFLQVARSLQGGEIPAMQVLSGAINGQRAFSGSEEDTACAACDKEKKENKACARCKGAHYCDRYCQKLHWPSHKKFCEARSKGYTTSSPAPCSESMESKNEEKH